MTGLGFAGLREPRGLGLPVSALPSSLLTLGQAPARRGRRAPLSCCPPATPQDKEALPLAWDCLLGPHPAWGSGRGSPGAGASTREGAGRGRRCSTGDGAGAGGGSRAVSGLTCEASWPRFPPRCVFTPRQPGPGRRHALGSSKPRATAVTLQSGPRGHHRGSCTLRPLRVGQVLTAQLPPVRQVLQSPHFIEEEMEALRTNKLPTAVGPPGARALLTAGAMGAP